MYKVARLTDANADAVESVVVDAKNELLKPGKVVNLAIAKGLPFIRRKYVKQKAKSAFQNRPKLAIS